MIKKMVFLIWDILQTIKKMDRQIMKILLLEWTREQFTQSTQD